MSLQRLVSGDSRSIIHCRPDVEVRLRNYRVVVHYADGSNSLLCLEANLSAARTAASIAHRTFQAGFARDPNMIAHPTRPVRVTVEQWVGRPIHGHWERVREQQGGFHRGFDKVRRGCDGQTRDRLTRGDRVPCELLAKKTRRGGWRARIIGTGHIGPVVCHREVPSEWKPGQTVILQLSSLSRRTGAAQLAWR